MKRCPECRRDYTDDTLSFCHEDGTSLVYGISADEPATAVMHSTAPPADPGTQAQIHMTHQTAVLPSGTGDISVPPRANLDKRLLAIPLLLVVIILAGYFSYRYLVAQN